MPGNIWEMWGLQALESPFYGAAKRFTKRNFMSVKEILAIQLLGNIPFFVASLLRIDVEGLFKLPLVTSTVLISEHIGYEVGGKLLRSATAASTAPTSFESF